MDYLFFLGATAPPERALRKALSLTFVSLLFVNDMVPPVKFKELLAEADFLLAVTEEASLSNDHPFSVFCEDV